MKRYLIPVLALLLALTALAAEEWKIFSGQVNGPVINPGKADPATFTHKKYSDLYWSEAYYHQLSSPDGSMITVQLGFNPGQSSIIFAYCRPGEKPFTEFLFGDFDEVKFDEQGFGITIGPNRFKLEGNKYYIDLDTGRVKAKITLDLLSPSISFGDGMVRYPDGKSFSSYCLPIPWAKASADVTLEGKSYRLEGFGSMNHDSQVLSPFYTPANWQAFWFYSSDHALTVTDFYTREKFGKVLTQRLVFVDQDRGMFTSTNFPMQWDDWVKAEGIPFRYPRHYTLTAEGGAAKLEVEVRASELLLLEDLYSNLPDIIKRVVKYITRNGYTVDYWADYTITYTHDGRTDVYKGRGIIRWTDLEEE